jgi:hypothetical protein
MGSRHSYATARLYTAEHGAPVSQWTARGEMGRSPTNMIEKVLWPHDHPAHPRQDSPSCKAKPGRALSPCRIFLYSKRATGLEPATLSLGSIPGATVSNRTPPKH